MVKSTKYKEVETKLDSLKTKLDTISVDELKKELESILRSLPKEEEKVTKKEEKIQEEVIVKPLTLEQTIDIPSRPITSGLQAAVPIISYEKKEEKLGVSETFYSEAKGYHLGSSEGYLMAELNTGQFTLDMNAAVRLTDNDTAPTFVSIEQRNKAKEKAKKLMPWSSEEDLMKYERKLVGRV